MSNLHEQFRDHKELVLSGFKDLDLNKLRALMHFLFVLSENNSNLAPLMTRIDRKNKVTLLKTIEITVGFILANEQRFVDAGKIISRKISELKS